MKLQFESETSLPNLFNLVKSEIKAFSNISGILEKINYDDNFNMLGKSFLEIFDFETVYAFTGRLTSAEETEGPGPVD
jgi:hypothetical protein